jgi:hypothetical protein
MNLPTITAIRLKGGANDGHTYEYPPTRMRGPNPQPIWLNAIPGDVTIYLDDSTNDREMYVPINPTTYQLKPVKR